MTTQLTEEFTALAADYLNLDSLFSAEELELRSRVRRFVDARIKPNINAWYEAAHFPRELAPELGEQKLLGMHLHGYGCPGGSAVEKGLAMVQTWRFRGCTTLLSPPLIVSVDRIRDLTRV